VCEKEGTLPEVYSNFSPWSHHFITALGNRHKQGGRRTGFRHAWSICCLRFL